MTQTQEATIRKYLGRMKYADLAEIADCTVETVRQFADSLSAERKAKEEAQRAANIAAAKAKEEQQQQSIKAKLDAGDEAGARYLWETYYGDSVIEEVEDASDATCAQIKEYLLEDYHETSDYEESYKVAYDALVESLIEDHYKSMRADAEEEVDQEYLESDEYREAFNKERNERLKDEVTKALDTAWGEYGNGEE